MACGMAAMALLASCSSGSPTGKSIEDEKPTTASDSASYYYGQIMAGRMSQMMAEDSIYKDAKYRDLYWEGMRKGLSMLKQDNTPEARAYNEGMQLGLMVANDMQRTSRDIPDFKFNPKLFEAGYGYAFTPDSVRGLDDAQYNLQKTMNALDEKAKAVRMKAMEKVMAAYAAKNGFKKDAQGLYVKEVRQGNGPAMAVGDSLLYGVEFSTNQNRDMKQYNMPPTGVVLGKTLPLEYPGAKALLNLKGGSTIQMLITPDELYGQAAKQFNFGNDEFLILTITTDYKGKTSYKAPEVKSVPQLKEDKK